MAKKDKDQIFKDYLAELEAINPGIKDILADEKVTSKLKEGVLARADYSSHMDTLRAEREQFASEVQEARGRIDGWQKWYGSATEEVAKVQTKLKDYVDTYGELDPASRRQVVRESGYTKEEFEKRLKEETDRRDLANLKFADDLTDVKIDYSTRFKGALDTSEVYKIAGDHGTDLKTAYNMFIADRVAEQQAKDFQIEKQKYADEKIAEYASKHNLPIIDTRSDVTHVLDVKDTPKTAHDRVAAAIAGLNASRR